MGKAALSELNKEGLSPSFHQLDIDDIDSIKAFADYIKEKHGGLDVLVNNAAIAYNVKFDYFLQFFCCFNYSSQI